MRKESQRNLWLYGLSMGLSRFGGQFQFLAVTSLTYAITGSILLTTMQMAVNSLPYILLAGVVGPIVDRCDPRKLNAVAFSLQALLTMLYITTRNVYAILLLNFLVASVGVFPATARSRLIPQMVGKENLFAANARLASINGATSLFAPAVAGMTIVHIGVNWAFVLNSFSYLFPALAMFFIKQVEDDSVTQTKDVKSNKSSFAPAIAFLRAQPSHIVMLSLFAAFNVGMWAVNALFYPYCRDILSAGPDVLGWSISVYFGAFLVTGVALEKWGIILSHPRLLPMGYVLGAIVWSGYTLTRNIPLVLLLSAFDGVIYTFTMTRIETWIQERAPVEARGRVSALVRAWEEIATITGQVGGGAVASLTSIHGGMRWATTLTLTIVAGGTLVDSLIANGSPISWAVRVLRGRESSAD